MFPRHPWCAAWKTFHYNFYAFYRRLNQMIQPLFYCACSLAGEMDKW